MQIRTRSVAAVTAAAVLAIGWNVSATSAVKAQGQTPAPAPSQASPNIPEQKLDKAAAALIRVTSLHEEYQQRIAAANPSDRQNIANEASTALKRAVTDQGLSVEEYSQIIETAKQNSDVRGKLLQRVRPESK
jgi:hypothetical protein